MNVSNVNRNRSRKRIFERISSHYGPLVPLTRFHLHMFSSAALCFRNKSLLRMQNRPFIFKILYLGRVPAAGANLFEFDPCPRQIQRLSFSLAPTLHLFPFFSTPLFHSAFDFTTINNTSNFLLLIPLRLADQSLRPKESIPADVFLGLWLNFSSYYIDPISTIL